MSNKKKCGEGNNQPKHEMKTIKVPIPTFPPTAMFYSVNKSISGELSICCYSVGFSQSFLSVSRTFRLIMFCNKLRSVSFIVFNDNNEDRLC